MTTFAAVRRKRAEKALRDALQRAAAVRRVKAASLVRYPREGDVRRAAAADELAAGAHALGLS